MSGSFPSSSKNSKGSQSVARVSTLVLYLTPLLLLPPLRPLPLLLLLRLLLMLLLRLHSSVLGIDFNSPKIIYNQGSILNNKGKSKPSQLDT